MDLDKITDAVGNVESGMNYKAVGDSVFDRARGAWQMHQGAWIDAGNRLGLNKSFWFYSSDPNVSRAYAKAYLEIICERGRKAINRDLSPQEVYACYRKGFGWFRDHGFKLDDLTKSEMDSCNRVANLCK